MPCACSMLAASIKTLMPLRAEIWPKKPTVRPSAKLAKAPPNFSFRGPYENRRVDALMRSVHAVLVPSVWWENSPLVIQEALLNRRPVICSDIGGMAEKVRDGVDGLHFPLGNPAALAGLLRGLAKDRAPLVRIVETMRSPEPPRAIARQHMALYQKLLAEPARATLP